MLFFFYLQEEHWKIESISEEEREAEQAREAEQVCRNTMKCVFNESCIGYLKFAIFKMACE